MTLGSQWAADPEKLRGMQVACLLHLVGDLVASGHMKPGPMEVEKVAAVQDLPIVADLLSAVAAVMLKHRTH
ncbi:hypothetical protein J3P71_03990 [Rhizobium leguminosarum]|uniref:hypothetical protein n=1 Tax=Rhizobium leguminosarum TaxID=384 RepID=UPI00144293E8|nr:hypothetical protein [Rhizobium leguminosarum]MBY5841425.1 hypothetical protein [Rhizobium leguminosarum]NKM81420.1 hypothetical protein [Rhizobium leguminosarum bv. viciae]QSZ08948.1 hypothetical protein J3P71_03990 [Rhizobium leguminosarum]